MNKDIKQKETIYFAWVIGYELLDFVDKYKNTECDLLYDFSNFVACDYIKSEEYKNTNKSAYEMFYKYLDNNGGIEQMFINYFNNKGGKIK